MTAPLVKMTPKLAAMLAPEIRKAEGIELPDEFATRIQAGEEKEFQRDAEAYLRSAKGIRFVYHERESRGRGNCGGVPDLLFCYAGHAVGVELKSSAGKTSNAQEKTLEEMQMDGWKVAVCRSIPEIKAFLDGLELQPKPISGIPPEV